MNVTVQIATMSRTDVCPADIAETADYANKAARKMQFQEQIKETANLNTFQTRISVQAAEYAQAYAPAVSGKLNGVNNKLIYYTFNSLIKFKMSTKFFRTLFCIF